MQPCPFLEKLPIELRLRIYEHLLRFNRPIKLRQVIPGSCDLSLLRVCRTIRDEALPVLYDLNTIIVTRNDFCRYTDEALKTPLRFDFARHLKVVSFGRSIACTQSDPTWQCDICQPHAHGFLRKLLSMRRLHSVLVDYRKYSSEMRAFGEQFGENLEKVNEMKLGLEVMRLEPVTFRLTGEAVGGVDVRFVCGGRG